jgi:hypothetical protein
MTNGDEDRYLDHERASPRRCLTVSLAR